MLNAALTTTAIPAQTALAFAPSPYNDGYRKVNAWDGTVMFELGLFLFIVAMGFSAGGIVVNLYQCLTGNRPGFQLHLKSVFSRVAYVPVIMFGGPMILMRNAINGRIIDGRPAFFLFLSGFIALTWSFLCGLFVVHLALATGLLGAG